MTLPTRAALYRMFVRWPVAALRRLVAAMPERGRSRFVAGLTLLPIAWLLRQGAFAAPAMVEDYYSQGVYPLIAALLGGINGWLPWSLAETTIAVAVLWGGWRFGRRLPTWRTAGRRWSWSGVLAPGALRLAMRLWIVAGCVGLAFVLLWGFNYARPPLEQRLRLDTGELRADEVLSTARSAVRRANAAHAAAAAPTDAPSSWGAGLVALDRELEAAFARLALPGDRLRRPSPPKPLLSSTLFAYLGISGLYIPFTGEPTFNRLVPDASLPVTVAHEKAHQRGITDEGEANLAAVLACAAADDPYIRYAGFLYAASNLTGAALRYAPEEASRVWSELAPGPRADVAALREFWERYQGRATRVATRLNDAYLRSNRVPGGVQSYGHVSRLLVGASRAGLVLGVD